MNQSNPLEMRIKSLAEVEKEHIIHTYTLCRFDKTRTALLLKVSRATFYRKLREHQIKNMKRNAQL